MSTVTNPVTQVADVDIKKQSIKGVFSPLLVAIDRFNSIVPVRITIAKPNAKILNGVALLILNFCKFIHVSSLTKVIPNCCFSIYLMKLYHCKHKCQLYAIFI
ncbi:hypothetical protein CTC_02282 [Clostridium tetani E88]|uniref:Uncharacterized protein n=1 Tax=Clostridium tetani (strain Massachusetts / E88) TaxID=212717 RepID=Q891T3_CLOTE|nr:hypothetical protein CTC_02282 [Clostridium tetani E88]